jgi:transposase
VVPVFKKDLEHWGATDKFTVLHDLLGMNATKLRAYCGGLGLYLVEMEGWNQATQDANEKLVFNLKEQKEIEKRRAQYPKEVKRLMEQIRRMQKALAEAALLLIA